MSGALDKVNFVDIAVGLNMIYDIVEQVRAQTGVTLTPNNIGQYIVAREKVRAANNVQLGITPAPENTGDAAKPSAPAAA